MKPDQKFTILVTYSEEYKWWEVTLVYPDGDRKVIYTTSIINPPHMIFDGVAADISDFVGWSRKAACS